jgi:hypothetical protein
MRWPYNTDLQRQLLEALIAGGEDQKAAEAHAAFVKPAITVPGDRALLQLSSRACLLSLEGKFEELLAAASQMHDGRQAAAARFEACLELGQLEQAGAALGSGTVPQGEWQLLLSLAWNRKGDQAQSVAARERAIAAFQKGRREERRIASLLAQAPDIPARTAESLVVEPLTKAIVLTALADVCPEQKLSLLALADTLNYRRRFPHNFLKSAIAESREGR